MSLQSFAFNAISQRFQIISGWLKDKFIPKPKIFELAIDKARQDSALIKALNIKMANGEITLAQWEDQFAATIKTLTIQQYLLGHPGRLAKQDFKYIESMLRFQYSKLRAFTLDVASGSLSLAQIDARANLYLAKTTEAYWKGTEQSHKKAGFRFERRIRTKDESCYPCIEYEKSGWAEIGTLPNPTVLCDCLANCGCKKVFKR